MKNKILCGSLVLALIFTVTPVGVSAAENDTQDIKVYHNNDFSDGFGNLLKKTDGAEMTFASKTANPDDKYLLINKKVGKDAYIEFNANAPQTQQLIIEFSLYLKSVSDLSGFLMLRDSVSGNENINNTLLTFGDGYLKSDTTEILKLKDSNVEEWVNVAVHYRFADNKFCTYIDGVQKTDYLTASNNMSFASRIRLQFREASSAVFGIDDLKIYSADTPADIENIPVEKSTIFRSEAYALAVLRGKKAVEIGAETLFNGTEKLEMTHTVNNDSDRVKISAVDAERLFGTQPTTAASNYNNVEYIILADEAQAQGYTLSDNGKGLYVFDLSELNFEADTRWDDAAKYMFFQRNSAEKLADMIKDGHGILFGGDSRFAQLNEIIEQDTDAVGNIVKSKYDEVITKADTCCGLETVNYTVDSSGKMLTAAKEFKKRAICLGFAYKMTDNEMYRTKILAELDKVLALESWNNSHFLDSSEIALGVSVIYDWLYSKLDDTRKNLIEEKLNTCFLHYAEQAYSGEQSQFWADTKINWGMVTNGSVAVAATVLFDKNPQKYSEILKNALRACEKSFYMLSGCGDWHEGPHYWEYTMEYTCFMLSALESAFGSDLGFSRLVGFEKTGYFGLCLDAPEGLNDFYDGYTRYMLSPIFFYLGNKLNNSDFTAAELYFETDPERSSAKNNKDIAMSLMWYDLNTTNTDIDISPDAYFNSTEAVAMREMWQMEGGTFVSFHGGDNSADHAHRDSGAFVYDSQGVRWAYDIGISPNYPDRKGLAAHNTLEFSGGAGQNDAGRAFVKKSDSGIGTAYAVMDLSEVYAADAQGVKRGIRLFEQRKNVEIRDEILTNTAKPVIWRMNTRADAEIVNDGFVLTQAGKKLCITVKSNAELTLRTQELNDLGLTDNTKQLLIEFDTLSRQNTYLSVMFGAENLGQEPSTALENWEIDEVRAELYCGGKRTYKPQNGMIGVKNVENSGMVIMAGYNAENILVDAKIPASGEVENSELCEYIKLYCFDSLNNLKPIRSAVKWNAK